MQGGEYATSFLKSLAVIVLTKLQTILRLIASNYRVMASTKEEDSLEVGGLKESQSISGAP